MYIKAKYNKSFRAYMGIEAQGFGSLYGGNHASVLSNEDTEHSVSADSTNTWPDQPVLVPVAYTDNLVASYNFDSDFTDYTGSHPLTPSGSTPPVAGVSVGVVNNCAEFNSSGDYTLAADSDDFSFTDGVSDLPFSVSFWANFTSYDSGFNGGAWLFSKRGDSTNAEWQIPIRQNQFAVTLFSGGGNSNFLNASLSYPPPIGSWHHYAVTYDGSATFAGIKVYIDGVSQTLANTSVGTYVGMVNGTQDLNIGSQSWSVGAGSFWGKMDETHIWKNRELTAVEVLDIYNTENAGTSILPPAPPAVYKVFRLQNFGGNRDAGNDFVFTNWDGVSISAFTGNNGADSVVAVLGGTEGSIVINGDTHFFTEEFSSESRSAAQTFYDGVEAFNLGDGYGGASGW